MGPVAAARVPARPRHRRRPAGQPRSRSACILGGHGITAWGATSDEAEANSRWIIETAAGLHRHPRRPGALRSRRGRPPAPPPGRAASGGGGAGAPPSRSIASRDHRMVGHFTDTDVVLEFLAGEKLERWSSSAPRAPTTSCAPRSSRSSSPPTPPTSELDRAPRALPRRLRRLLRAPRRRPTRPPMRGADPLDHPRARRRHVLLRQGQADRPGRRRVLRQRHQRDARRRGPLDLRPDLRGREVPHRVLGARGGQAPTAARSPSATPAASPSSPAAPAASARPSPPGSPPTAPASSSPTSTPTRPPTPPPSSAAPTSPSASRATSPTPPPCGPPSTRPSSPSAASTSSSTTPGCRSPSRCSRRPRTTGTSSTT